MQTQNTFDLPSQISQWKNQLQTMANMDSDRIEELESHLLDEIDGFPDGQLNDEEKFMLARHRIGSEQLLAEAYKDTKRFNFQKASWFGQALIFMSIFTLVSRMTLLLATVLPLNGHTWVETSLLGAFIMLIVMKTPAILTTYFIYRWTQKQEKVIRANSIALTTVVVLGLVYLLQTFTFHSTSFVLDRRIWPLLWAASTYILVFLGFAILNLKESLKLKRAIQN